MLSDLRSPNYYNDDFAVWKDTPIAERMRVQIRMEVFNLFNRVVFAAPNLTLTNPAQFGVISGQDNRPRQIQLAARFEF